MLGADGTGEFTFRAPQASAGSLILVDLVGWGITANVGVIAGGPVPIRVDAGLSGSGMSLGMGTAELASLTACIAASLMLARGRRGGGRPDVPSRTGRAHS
jgi:hypothetical protein